MAWPESLTTAQQQQIQNYVDQVLRPDALTLAKALAKANVSVIPQYLFSPSGATSTFASPAADSVGGLLGTLSGSDVVPILNSGLALISPIIVSKITTYTGAFNTLLGTYWTLAAQEDFAGIVGSVNIVST